MKKILYGAAATIGGLMTGLIGIAQAQAQFSTTTLGTQIDNVNANAYDYVGVFITHYWPFLLGALVLLGVIAFGKRIVEALFH